MRRLGAAIVAAALAVAAPAGAQVPAGGEFRVNAYTTGNQYGAAAAFDKDGDFVVVWTNTFGILNQGEVVARRFDARGAPRGGEFLVNTYTTHRQYVFAQLPVASRPDGRFVVVWTSNFQDGDLGGVFGQRFEADGRKAGPEFQVNTTTTGHARSASVAIAPHGTFVVVWGNDRPGQPSDVFGQMFDATGNRLGGEFRVNTYTPSYQAYPRAVMDAAGNFVVVWGDAGQDGSGSGVFGQRFAADGVRRGAEFRVNTTTAGDQSFRGLGGSADGRFVVTWGSLGDGSGRGIFAQRFDASGAPAGGEFLVNAATTGDQFFPDVSSDESGHFVAGWNSVAVPGTLVARRFRDAATARGPEFQLPTNTLPAHEDVRIATDHVGSFVATWSHSSQDGSGFGTFAQRYGGLVPAALALDTIADGNSDGNGVLEPGEQADMRPAWRNVNGADQVSIAGAIVVGGPGNPSVVDGNGSYGTMVDGVVQPCADCYELAISDPTPRPAAHWDLIATEALAPDAQGQQKAWTVHVGDTFADVDGAAPFYPFVEVLVHHRVTGGCTASTYCPGTSASREQMAVFLLVAKESAGYVPPPCGASPRFADVPVGSVFCRWIEELARRGVVAGCGGGNYCPSGPVTREQMAVFVLATLDAASDPVPCLPPGLYADVPATSPFCRWIEELTRRGIVTGCGGGNYCPVAAVTREQMSVFISRTFGLTLYGP